MSEFSLIPAVGISASGLDAETRRMEITANNVANAETTHGPDGKIFRRRQVVFAAKLDEAMNADSDLQKMSGVKLQEITEDQRAPRQVYRPGHPDADAEGYVSFPNINPMEEMVDMMTASRAYEANLTAIKIAKDMAARGLEITGR